MKTGTVIKRLKKKLEGNMNGFFILEQVLTELCGYNSAIIKIMPLDDVDDMGIIGIHDTPGYKEAKRVFDESCAKIETCCEEIGARQ